MFYNLFGQLKVKANVIIISVFILEQELLAVIPGLNPGKYQDIPGSTSNFLV